MAASIGGHPPMGPCGEKPGQAGPRGETPGSGGARGLGPCGEKPGQAGPRGETPGSGGVRNGNSSQSTQGSNNGNSTQDGPSRELKELIQQLKTDHDSGNTAAEEQDKKRIPELMQQLGGGLGIRH